MVESIKEAKGKFFKKKRVSEKFLGKLKRERGVLKIQLKMERNCP